MRGVLMLFFTCCFIQLNAQDKRLPDNYLGFGWVVVFGYDIAFFSSNEISEFPTIDDFFEQKNKYGIRINEESSSVFALKECFYTYVLNHEKMPDSLQIIPVIASYNLYYSDFSNMKFANEEAKINFKPYGEMMQVYTYNSIRDSVLYKFGMGYDFKFRAITK